MAVGGLHGGHLGGLLFYREKCCVIQRASSRGTRRRRFGFEDLGVAGQTISIRARRTGEPGGCETELAS